jgi:BlaI family transcriptional regulator, penicillinase repressor
VSPTGSDIPPAELEVLGALWRLGKGTVREVQQDLESQGRTLAYTTVLTLLGRLEGRGCAVSRKSRQILVYRPRVTRDRVLADRLGALVKGLGEGEAAPLIRQLVKAHRLSGKDIRDLRDLLESLDREDPSRGARDRGDPA